MTALEDARVTLAGFNGGDFTHPQGCPGMAAGLARALAALIAEYERLTAPPTGDEREALVALELASFSKVMSDGYPSLVYRTNEQAADVVLAAGFRRQGPITDALIALEDVASLPVETILRDEIGRVFIRTEAQKYHWRTVHGPGFDMSDDQVLTYAPVRVLYKPDLEAAREADR